METSEWLPNMSALQRGAAQALRRAFLVRLWSISGWAIERYYRRLLVRHGRSPHALAERGDDKDREFYLQLFAGLDLPERLSVLDIGCGMGDLIDFLQERQANIEAYLGLDLVQQFVDIGRQEYAPPCRFERANFVSRSFRPAEKFNLVVCMGTLVSRVVAYEDYVEYAIEKMLALSSGHVVFNLITEVDRSLGNYRNAHRVGEVTCLPRARLDQIVARVAERAGASYAIHSARIYPDAVDAFVRISLP